MWNSPQSFNQPRLHSSLPIIQNLILTPILTFILNKTSIYMTVKCSNKEWCFLFSPLVTIEEQWRKINYYEYLKTDKMLDCPYNNIYLSSNLWPGMLNSLLDHLLIINAMRVCSVLHSCFVFVSHFYYLFWLSLLVVLLMIICCQCITGQCWFISVSINNVIAIHVNSSFHLSILDINAFLLSHSYSRCDIFYVIQLWHCEQMKTLDNDDLCSEL
jgi:hypothetical protein